MRSLNRFNALNTVGAEALAVQGAVAISGGLE
jgi:hypothetical protein